MERLTTRTTIALAAGLAALAAVPAAPTAPPPDPVLASSDAEEHCFSLDPPAAVASPIDDHSEVVQLRVRVLFDVAESAEIVALRNQGTEESLAAADAMLRELVAELGPIFEGARPSFDNLAIDLDLSYDVLSVLDDRTPSSTVELIADAKEQYGGSRPADADVVYVGTDDLASGVAAGQADCVGGAAYDSHAFASGDLYRGREPSVILGLNFNDSLGEFTFGHEIGHLLGAHHHFANCAESLPTYSVFGDVTDTCTLMINDNSLGQNLFSSVNGMVVRGYAEEFIGP